MIRHKFCLCRFIIFITTLAVTAANPFNDPLQAKAYLINRNSSRTDQKNRKVNAIREEKYAYRLCTFLSLWMQHMKICIQL